MLFDNTLGFIPKHYPGGQHEPASKLLLASCSRYPLTNRLLARSFPGLRPVVSVGHPVWASRPSLPPSSPSDMYLTSNFRLSPLSLSN